MKKLASFTLLLGVGAFAHAQSSVTLFGVLDVNARYVKNDETSLKTLSAGGINTSRFGVRGTEDLGGGLKAGFWLESGINPDTGSTSEDLSKPGSRFWNRRSTVSLSSSTLGEIRLGRDFTPTYNGYTAYDAFGSNGVGAVDKFFVSTLGAGNPSIDTGTRADNLVSYFTPGGLGGFYGQLSAAAGEGNSGKRYLGGRAGYAAGPLDVSAAYGQTRVTPGASGEDTYQVVDFGAAYDFGVAKLLGIFGQSKYGELKMDVLEIGALVPVGNGTIRASYVRANAKGGAIESDDATQLALGYVHNLSKRTALYTTVARVNNKGAAKFAVASSPALPAGKDSTGFELGIRHSF
jgi:predicted porin